MAITHIVLVVLPCITFGPALLIVLVPQFKKTKDSGTLVFIFISALCTIAPSTYGLLIDISLITNKSILGGCSTVITSSFVWVFLGVGHSTLLVSTAFFSVVQYMTIRGYKKNLLKMTTALLLVSFLVGLITALSQIVDDFAGESFQIRGSYCGLKEGGKRLEIVNIVGIIIIVIIIIPSVSTVILFSILSYKYVKRHTIENGKVAKSVLLIMIFITISVVIFRFLPVVNALLQISGNVTALSWSLNYSLELSYSLYLLLIIIIHKTVRQLLTDKLKRLAPFLMKKSTRVVPTSPQVASASTNTKTP